MVTVGEILRNLGRNNNSPATAYESHIQCFCCPGHNKFHVADVAAANLLTKSGKADNLIIRFMKKTSITVTEASRNFADCVNRAHYQNVTFVLLKNGEPVARLVPDNEKVCVGRDLAEALAKTDLPEKEARAWHRDLEAARKSLKSPTDKWR